MSDLVDKVARAIWNAVPGYTPWDELHKDGENETRTEARAAIAVVLRFIAEDYPERGPAIASNIARENGVSLDG